LYFAVGYAPCGGVVDFPLGFFLCEKAEGEEAEDGEEETHGDFRVMSYDL
jgi:hypothetical protein